MCARAREKTDRINSNRISHSSKKKTNKKNEEETQIFFVCVHIHDFEKANNQKIELKKQTIENFDCQGKSKELFRATQSPVICEKL